MGKNTNNEPGNGSSTETNQAGVREAEGGSDKADAAGPAGGNSDRHDIPPCGLTIDPIVRAVMMRLNSRSLVGLKKYGVSLARDDTNLYGFLVHLQAELLDGANYCERLRRDALRHNRILLAAIAVMHSVREPLHRKYIREDFPDLHNALTELSEALGESNDR